MEKVAIIGMGSSGMAVVGAYEKEVPPNTIEIDCYDREESFGRGFPYREDSDHLILNLKTKMISYNYEDNNDFFNWHKENNLKAPEYQSRDIFGQYTRDRLRETINNLGANVIHKKVIRLDFLKDQGKWELEDEDSNIRVYDRVHLCSGELPQKDPYNLKGNKNYISDPYPVKNKLKPINEDDSVAIVGLGLTAVDVATYLLEEKKIKKLYMFSRTNVIPTVRVEPVSVNINIMNYTMVSEIIDKGNGLISFEEFDRLFNEELNSHGVDYETFVDKHMVGGIEGLKVNISEPEDLGIVQGLLPPMNLVFNKVWVSLTEKDRILFRKKYHPFMCLNRSPLPLVSAEILIKAVEEGYLSVLNNISNVESIDNGLFELSSLGNDPIDEINWICNATGLDTSLKGLNENPLVSSLINKRYLQVDNYNGVTVLPEDVSAVSPRFGNISNLHVHGVLISGVQYRNNSTMIIQKTAHDLVKRLYS